MPVNYQVITEQVVGAEIIVNTFAFSSATNVSPLTLAEAQAIRVHFDTFFSNDSTDPSPLRGINHLRPDNAVLSRIIVREILAGNTPGVYFEFPSNTAGASNNPISPLQIAMIISMRTATPGRKGRGRVYLGPWTEASLDEVSGEPEFVSTAVDQVADAFGDLVSNIETEPLNASLLCVWSRADAAFRVVTSFRVNSHAYTQRRRAVKLPPQHTVIGTF